MTTEGLVNSIIDSFARTTEDVFSLQELKDKLMSKKKLVIKYGVDVTAPFLHLGHAVNLWMMRRLQEEGHKIVFLIGDFTTKIGDPTGKSETRPIILEEQIRINSEEFIQQVSQILITEDSSVFEIRKNSEWYSGMKMADFLDLLSTVTHSRLISRDMFQKRIKESREIYMHEMIYPILQGYDSVMLNSDITIVGSDQLFNEMLGRFFQEKSSQTPQVIITTKITLGLDGKSKQSKSIGNYIAITDTPKDKFGKIMSLPDNLIIQWMEVYTDIPIQEIEKDKKDLENGKNPRDLKLKLAQLIAEKYHGKEIALQEKKWFLNTFSSRQFPQDATVIELDGGEYNILKLLNLLFSEKSNSDLRRLIQQGGIRINENKILDPFSKIIIKSEKVEYLKVGKKNFFKLVGK